MTVSEAMEKLLHSYEIYYNVNRETPTEPFVAEAVFHSHDEQFFLVKSAKLSEAESHEYVFFAEEETLTAERLQFLADTAWAEGTSRVEPFPFVCSGDPLRTFGP